MRRLGTKLPFTCAHICTYVHIGRRGEGSEAKCKTPTANSTTCQATPACTKRSTYVCTAVEPCLQLPKLFLPLSRQHSQFNTRTDASSKKRDSTNSKKPF